MNTNTSTNDSNDQSTTAVTSSSPTVNVDPFQIVDPFASQSDVGSTTANNDWFQPPNNENTTATETVDPFVSQPTEQKLYPVLPTNTEETVDPVQPKPTEPTENIQAVASPRTKKAAPKANPNIKGLLV